MLITIVPILAALLGGLVYGLAEGKVSELGRLTFLAGVLVTVYCFAGHTIHIG